MAAIMVDSASHAIRIANREALPADGLPAIVRLGSIVRLSELTDQADEDGGQRVLTPRREMVYRVDLAHEGRRVAPGASSSGVTALAGVGDGRLLELEASRDPAMPPFRNRIYVVDPCDASGA